MKLITLLPADQYVVVNKTILTEIDKKNLINLYEPIIGFGAVSLYLTLWSDLDTLELMSRDFTHHHLMSILKCSLEGIKQAREALEAVGLMKTYFKEGDINSYVYELYSPLAASEFFNNPILNIVLYNNVGEEEYNYLKKMYRKVNVDLKDYVEITKTLNETFESTSMPIVEARSREVLPLNIESDIDFDLIISSIPKGILNEKAINKKMKELIINLSFIYDLDTLKMMELIRASLNERGSIEKDTLRKNARKYYQFNHGNLPTLIYRTQPEYLKTPMGDTSRKGRIIGVFENTSPYDFLKSKYHGANPTSRDLKLLEMLMIDLELNPAVVNVLLDYVLKKNNNKLSASYVETIAGQWKRSGVKTAREAMDLAEKEHKKMQKSSDKKVVRNLKEAPVPVWFDKTLEKAEVSDEEAKELEELLKI
ncbi:replication initiation and membrane attachment protein (DnaB) [Mycoplasma sp. CAG:776]|nr:replication initiation and membrane attachment protein (DnaB) [Mycoplasma sp. CAG:776]